MKCEFCHDGKATHQYIDEYEQEFYICDKCFHEKTDDYFNDLTEPDKEGLSSREQLPPTVVATLAEIRNAIGKPRSFSLDVSKEDFNLDASVDFDAVNKKITLEFHIFDENATDKDSSAKWVFDVSNKKKILMNANCRFGNENSIRETIYRFNQDNAPGEAITGLCCIIAGLASSKDELECNFD